jgi:hypothetical protein
VGERFVSWWRRPGALSPRHSIRRRGSTAALLCALVASAPGCALDWASIDLVAVQGARRGLDEFEKHPVRPPGSDRAQVEAPSTGSVLLGELIAIFPGFFVHGLGHNYAGDYKTWRRLSHIGQLGYLLTAVGGGLAVGAYYIDKGDDDNDYQGIVYSMYGAGGTIGVIGVGYWLVAWFYDMIDTPRAVESGGEPPRRTPLLDSMDLFE